MTQYDLLKYGVKLLIIFMVMPVHEYAHAWTAAKLGDDSQAYKGRLTLNPFAHIDIFGAICIFLTGFGWAKPVEVNPLRFKHYRKGMALTAAAGPISNLLVGTVGAILWKIVACIYWTGAGFSIADMEKLGFSTISMYQLTNGNEALFWLQFILYYFVLLNVGLAVFNLIPIPPLDGSKILSYFTSYKVDKFIQQYQMYISIGFLVLIFSGLIDGPLGFLQGKAFELINLLTIWVPKVLDIFM